MAAPVLRHRVVLTFSAEAAGQTPDDFIRDLVESGPVAPAPPKPPQRGGLFPRKIGV
jgi:hypothetical protein